MTQLPKFTVALLHPRYWMTWLGIGFLWLLVQLPYPVIFRLGTSLGRLAQTLMKRRARIAYRNLELCFPQMSEAERHDMVSKNFESVGMGLMETGMAWFWSDKRMARWSKVTGTGMEPVHTLQANQTGVLLIGVHFLTLEIGARMFGMQAPGIGVYRPNDNPVIDLIQTNGRMRSNKSMIDRKDLKGMIRALKAGEVVWYAPITTMAPRPASLSPSSPLMRPLPRPAPGCWRGCPKPPSFPLFPAVCRMAQATN